MKTRYWAILSITSIILVGFNPIASWAGCTVSHTECHYECIEYYPNGTDCKKSKKICETICDDFDVIPSGGTPHGGVSKGAMTGLVEKEEVRVVTVGGKLDRIYAIGGETTGWVLELDSDMELKQGMKKVKHIEVDPSGKHLDSLEGKQVHVTGSLTWRHGVERGDYPVIVINLIKRLK
jgi:hypothetical protein